MTSHTPTICVINPNTSTAMSEGIATSARRVSRGDILMLTSRHGPASLEGHFDEAIAVPGLLERIIETEQGETRVDGYLIACFGDPGLAAAREVASVPVMGVAEAGMQMATMVARRFSVVTTLGRTLPIAERLLHEYGKRERCAGLHACELPVAAFESDDDSVYETLLAACREALSTDDSDAILLGCAGMSELAERLGEALGVPVIDGVTAGVALLEAISTTGYPISKHNDRALPIAKPIRGAFEHLSRSPS
ncbi:aspartate/glutamate racemase family protein [Kushneria marisflavi]|uniref:Asp/Glu racemase n=1 Tax=Kushneria marisflavi TaxID=157779 RepID=A0A240UMZ4_9GAMM|nr:aspartate/glutamate racemase family protein [Kushneria marisflavi]ART62877.1 Asp/Glu racemase [Kushneria marisflavi]RKD84906.1 allantoin racemase [Kushneria marisflavi]